MSLREIDPKFDLGQLTKEERQRWIDSVRFDVLAVTAVHAVFRGVAKPRIQHLRFPRPELRSRQLRDWNPPSDSDRELWERGMRLEIDVGEIPPSAKKLILEAHRERRQNGDAIPNWKLEKISEMLLKREKKASRLWLPR